jgi:ubiquinone/menaquinone biosynthesis C-methylase UbiE
MGADHAQWAKSTTKSLSGIDLTPRAVQHTVERLAKYGLKSDVQVGDAEKLHFADDSFDLIYSWGVLHHSPNTQQAFEEVLRILRPGGVARIMIYHKYSLTGYMLWLRYGLLTGNLNLSLTDIYARYLESPGTKAYTVNEVKRLCSGFSEVSVNPQLGFGDLLEGEVGQRHRGGLLTLAKLIWPRWLFKRLFKKHGLYLLIEARK